MTDHDPTKRLREQIQAGARWAGGGPVDRDAYKVHVHRHGVAKSVDIPTVGETGSATGPDRRVSDQNAPEAPVGTDAAERPTAALSVVERAARLMYESQREIDAAGWRTVWPESGVWQLWVDRAQTLADANLLADPDRLREQGWADPDEVRRLREDVADVHRNEERLARDYVTAVDDLEREQQARRLATARWNEAQDEADRLREECVTKAVSILALTGERDVERDLRKKYLDRANRYAERLREQGGRVADALWDVLQERDNARQLAADLEADNARLTEELAAARDYAETQRLNAIARLTPCTCSAQRARADAAEARARRAEARGDRAVERLRKSQALNRRYEDALRAIWHQTGTSTDVWLTADRALSTDPATGEASEETH